MKITLSDVAKRVGVTPSSVQRALNGLEGVSEEKRIKIQQVAMEMGYKRNLMASSLKTGVKKIAVILPEPSHNNRYYAGYLWSGVEKCVDDFSALNIDIIQNTYIRKPEKQSEKLMEVLDQYEDDLAGILTMGTQDTLLDQSLERCKKKNITVVFVGTDSLPDRRLCCVRTYDEMAGSMAADLLINFHTIKERSKVILTGDFSISDQFYNAQGFERHIFENHVPLELLKLSNDSDLNVVKEGILEILKSGLDICAIYSCSARNTVPMCEAVVETDCLNKVRTIGSDVFTESIDFVQRGVLNAIIHKNPAEQAYLAMKTIITNVLWQAVPYQDTLFVDSVIVMKSNLGRYL